MRLEGCNNRVKNVRFVKYLGWAKALGGVDGIPSTEGPGLKT